MPLSAIAARKLAQEKRQAAIQAAQSVPFGRATPAVLQVQSDSLAPSPLTELKQPGKSKKRKRKQDALPFRKEPEVITGGKAPRSPHATDELPTSNEATNHKRSSACEDTSMEVDLPNNEQPLSPDVMKTDEDLINLSSSASDDEILTRGATPGNKVSRYSDVSLSTVDRQKVMSRRVHGLDAAVIPLLPGEKVVAVGQYELWVRKGTVTIYGAVLHASPKAYRIHAPSSHALPVILAVQNPYGGDAAAEVVLLSCETGMRLIKTLSPGFEKLWNASAPENDTQSFRILWSSAEDLFSRSLRPLEEGSPWKSLATSLITREDSKPPVVLVCGPKGTGKSTFTRFLTNAFLCSQRYDGVAYLDIDPGQPEYRPPGDLSLCLLKEYNFGPSYCHPNCIEGQNYLSMAHHFGFIMPRDDPQHYVACVMDLFRGHQRQHPGLPLLINCSGWILGSGLECLETLIASIKPTNTIYTSTDGPDEVTEVLNHITKISNSHLHTVPSAQSAGPAQRTSAQLRAMLTMSYFHATNVVHNEIQWNSMPVNEMTEQLWSYSGSKPLVSAITHYTDYIVPKFFSYIIEMSILSIVAVFNDHSLREELDLDQNLTETLTAKEQDTWHENSTLSEFDPSNNQDQTHIVAPAQEPRPRALRRTPEGIPYYFRGTGAYIPLDPANSQTLGQALVRGVDAETQCLRVVTPVGRDMLEEYVAGGAVIVLVRGRLDRPDWAHLEPYHVGLWREQEYEKWKASFVGSESADTDGIQARDDHMRFDVRAWAEKTPWVGIVDGKDYEWRRRQKVWKVRRNLETSDSK